MTSEQFATAHPLPGHPVLSREPPYKAAYLACIAHIAAKHNHDAVFTRAVLAVYRKAFDAEPALDSGIDECLKTIWCERRREPYRYCFLNDLFYVLN
ncbi:MAG: hypothetical protein LBS62_12130, partial [Clostridiales bacterium]|nr:hypothetical protein [Clostridiales bacterium]